MSDNVSSEISSEEEKLILRRQKNKDNMRKLRSQRLPEYIKRRDEYNKQYYQSRKAMILKYKELCSCELIKTINNINTK